MRCLHSGEQAVIAGQKTSTHVLHMGVALQPLRLLNYRRWLRSSRLLQSSSLRVVALGLLQLITYACLKQPVQQTLPASLAAIPAGGALKPSWRIVRHACNEPRDSSSVVAGRKWGVLGAAARRGDLGQVSRMYEELEEIGGVDNLLTNSQAIAAASKTGNLEAAEMCFNAIRNPDLTAYSSVLAAAASRGKMDAVESWFDRLLRARFSPNLVVYNTVINGAARASNLRAAEYWFRRMQSEGLEGDVPTYGSLINAAKNSGNRSAATYWYKEMIAAGLEPHLMAYCSLISASEDAAAAAYWVTQIQARGLQMNNVVYNALMKIHASKKHSRQAERVFGEMEKARVAPQATEYNCLMSSYVQHALSGGNGAYDVYKRMLANGVAPNIATLATLRKAVGKTRFWAMRVSDLITGPIEELDSSMPTPNH